LAKIEEAKNFEAEKKMLSDPEGVEGSESSEGSEGSGGSGDESGPNED